MCVEIVRTNLQQVRLESFRVILNPFPTYWVGIIHVAGALSPPHRVLRAPSVFRTALAVHVFVCTSTSPSMPHAHHPQLGQVLVIGSTPVTHASVLRHSSLNPVCLCSRSTACSHSASIRYNSRLCQCATTHLVLVSDLLCHSKQGDQNTKTSPSTLRYGHYPGGNLTSVNRRLSRTAHFQRNRSQPRARAVTNFLARLKPSRLKAQAQSPSPKTRRIV